MEDPLDLSHVIRVHVSVEYEGTDGAVEQGVLLDLSDGLADLQFVIGRSF